MKFSLGKKSFVEIEDLHGPKDTETVEKTKEEVAEAFKGADLPVPQEYQGKPTKLSKTEAKLAHVALDHLYSGVLQQLRVAEQELEKLTQKKPDNQLAATLFADISAMREHIEATINTVGETLPVVGGVQELDDIFKKLYEEMMLAATLQKMPDVPKGKMH